MAKFYVVQRVGAGDSTGYGVARTSKGDTEFDTVQAAKLAAADIAEFANGTLFVVEAISEVKTKRPDE